MSNHFEGLGKTWLTLLNDPEKEVPAVVMQVMKEGKTRDCWQRKDSKEETMVLAWPVETGFRAGVTVHGNAGDQLRPVSTYPLLEGAPNDMTVKVGDKVITSKYAGTQVKVDGDEVTIVRQSDILAIVE